MVLRAIRDLSTMVYQGLEVNCKNPTTAAYYGYPSTAGGPQLGVSYWESCE
jgi:hypothetical protein